MNNKLFFVAIIGSLLFTSFTKPFYRLFSGPSMTASSSSANATQQQIAAAKHLLKAIGTLQIILKTADHEHKPALEKNLILLQKQLQSLLHNAVIFRSKLGHAELNSCFREQPETDAEMVTESHVMRITAEFEQLRNVFFRRTALNAQELA